MSIMLSRFICVVIAGKISMCYFCVCMFLCVHVCAHVWGLCLCSCVVHVEAGGVHKRCLFFIHSPFCFLKQGVSLSLKPIQLKSLVSKSQGPSCLCLLSTGGFGMHCRAWLLV